MSLLQTVPLTFYTISLMSFTLGAWMNEHPYHDHKLEIFIHLFPWKAVWLLKIKIHIKKKSINLLEISV